MGVDFLQQGRSQFVPLQQMAEVQDGGLVRQRACEPQADEAPDGIRLVEEILHPGVAEVVEELDTVGPEHDRQRAGVSAPAGLGVEGTDAVLQALPRNQTVHALQE